MLTHYPFSESGLMLTSIRLQNFKCYSDSGVVPLAPLTVVVGCNNAGKSSLFQPLLALKHEGDHEPVNRDRLDEHHGENEVREHRSRGAGVARNSRRRVAGREAWEWLFASWAKSAPPSICDLRSSQASLETIKIWRARAFAIKPSFPTSSDQ